MPEPSLVGRDRELGELDQLIDRIDQRGGALVLWGAPGVGKSALLDEASRRASGKGMRVLRTTGIQAEARMPFAGLHQLLRPILRDAGNLTEVQRANLLEAFGPTGRTPEVFLVALAALSLLSDCATARPILLIADDVHWLDPATCEALTFIARRLESDPIVLLATSREGSETAFDRADLPELRLAGLDPEAAAILLDAEAPDLPTRERQQLLAAAAGNPLALVELPTASKQLTGGVDALDWLPLTDRLERAFAAREQELPSTTRSLLLVAALNEGYSLREVVLATSRMVGAEITPDDLLPAQQARLIEVEHQELRFRHPLIRSATAQAASPTQRYAAHAALADVLVDQEDRWVWHQAACTLGPDEAVACALEAAAGRAGRQMGGAATAVAALQRAAQLSDTPAKRGARLLAAAEIAFEMGEQHLVELILQDASGLKLEPLEHARLVWLRKLVQYGESPGAARIGPLVEIVERMKRWGAVDLAMGCLLTVAMHFLSSSPDLATRELVVSVAQDMPVAPHDARLLAILAFAAPLQQGSVVLARLCEPIPETVDDPVVALRTAVAAQMLGGIRESAGFCEEAVTGLRSEGRLTRLSEALEAQAWSAIWLGTWDLAASAADEAARLARETGNHPTEAAAKNIQAVLAALRGDYAAVEALTDETEGMYLPTSPNPVVAVAHFARGLAALGVGSYAAAYEQLWRVFDPADPAFDPTVGRWVIAELVDAAVHSGHAVEAAAAVNDLEGLADRTASPLLLAGLTVARPLLFDDGDAEPQFEAGLAADLADYPFFRARLLLSYGMWLRRQRRVGESRAPLRQALEELNALGAGPWAERARQELRASGEKVPRSVVDRVQDLTPQELQIALMAATGLTNREIGERLFFSHRTVGSHLYRIFPKLGINSRSELARALRAEVTVHLASPTAR